MAKCRGVISPEKCELRVESIFDYAHVLEPRATVGHIRRKAECVRAWTTRFYASLTIDVHELPTAKTRAKKSRKNRPLQENINRNDQKIVDMETELWE